MVRQKKRSSRPLAKRATTSLAPGAIVAPCGTQDATCGVSGAGQEEEQQLKCYTRKRAVAAAVPVEVASSAVAERNCGVQNCEEKISGSVPLRGQRSLRKRRGIVPPPFQPTLPVVEEDGGKVGDAAGVEEIMLWRPRPQRQRKRKVDHDFVPSDSAYCDWAIEYPDEDCPSDYHDLKDLELGEVETISLSEDCASDVSNDAERPMSLNLQTEIQQTRKARRILVNESPFWFSPPPKQQKHDESAKSFDASVVSESCLTPSEDSTRDALPDSATEETSVLEEVVLVEAKVKVRKKKKHARPKVKGPPKLKVVKVPKIPNTRKRKNVPPRGAFEHSSPESVAKGAAVRKCSVRAKGSPEFMAQASASGREAPPASEGERQDERAPPEPTDQGPHTFDIDHDLFAMATGKICVDLAIQEPSSGISTQKESEDGGGDQCSVPVVDDSPSFIQSAELEDPGGSEVTMEMIPESEVQPTLGGVESVLGAAWTEEKDPSTPRGNATVVVLDTNPIASSPSTFSGQPSFGDVGDCSTDSDDEQAGPVRRKRSQRTRRSLDFTHTAPLPPPKIPFFRMTEAQQSEHVRELSKYRQYLENPMGLVENLINGVPERLLSEVKTTAEKLVLDIFDKEAHSGESGAQEQQLQVVVHKKRKPRAKKPQLQIVVHKQRKPRAKKPQLQIVVHRPKSSAMVVHQKEKKEKKKKPKVILDTMTIKTFKRLMLQGGEVKDSDHADNYWAKDRELWSTRAHQFISIMREVQGDRTFSKWGGSVLDSMVGVFLTQNVSDFLSSNAFMMLRAHYPVRGESRSGSGVSEEQTSVTASEVSTTHTLIGTTLAEESPTPLGKSVEPLSPNEVPHRDQSDQSDVEGSVSSRSSSVLEKKFQCTLNCGVLTPNEATEKMLAASLRAILGKKKNTEREAAEGQVVPLHIVKWKVPRNKRPAPPTKVKSLRGADRGNYEFKAKYKLNPEQKRAWEAVRDEVLSNKEGKRDPFTADSVDWEAVRCASVEEVANVIRERGMHNILSGRFKSLLDRIHHDEKGSFDLEWIRKLSPTSAKNYLHSVRGLGLKSVECIRLLSLHHPSFPVDTNVGRIVVRLGWVPIMPLPDEVQLHLLDNYPLQAQIQKYIWPRLCTLDQQTLYEFHYQLITFGKVFCTMRQPNCNACPLRSQCKHYASAYCSARPLLHGPEDSSNNSMQQVEPLMPNLSVPPHSERLSRLTFVDQASASPSQVPWIPIIEEPNSPVYERDIEDEPYTDEINLDPPDSEQSYWRSGSPSLLDTPMVYVDLNTPTLESGESIAQAMTEDAVQEPGGSVEDVEKAFPQPALDEEVASLPSTALVLLPYRASRYPAAKLKTTTRLRTIHYVYELPDHHPLLAKLDKRDPEDPCSYLLLIWSSVVPEAIPKLSDNDESNSYTSSQPCEATVRGTLLVPCRTAMKGSFPLNGTYFQVNEVFADQQSSLVPVDVPRTLLWDLRRRFVYMGTSVSSIFKDMCQDEIQCCFKKGYVCVRAFDRRTRLPRLLTTALHQSGAKVVVGASTVRRPRQKNEIQEKRASKR